MNNSKIAGTDIVVSRNMPLRLGHLVIGAGCNSYIFRATNHEILYHENSNKKFSSNHNSLINIITFCSIIKNEIETTFSIKEKYIQKNYRVISTSHVAMSQLEKISQENKSKRNQKDQREKRRKKTFVIYEFCHMD